MLHSFVVTANIITETPKSIKFKNGNKYFWYPKYMVKKLNTNKYIFICDEKFILKYTHLKITKNILALDFFTYIGSKEVNAKNNDNYKLPKN